MTSFIIKENGKIIDKDMSGYGDIFFSPECFLSFDEIVEHLAKDIDHESKSILINTNQEDLIGFHMTIGMVIRNRYGLWLEGNPITSYSESTDARHPDQISFRILEQLQSKLL